MAHKLKRIVASSAVAFTVAAGAAALAVHYQPSAAPSHQVTVRATLDGLYIEGLRGCSS